MPHQEYFRCGSPTTTSSGQIGNHIQLQKRGVCREKMVKKQLWFNSRIMQGYSLPIVA
jgi:hypothetical protein